METKELLKVIYRVLEEKKGENIRVIDISGISSLADYFIITSGGNVNQIQAMADEVQEKCHPVYPSNVEGYRSANWILLDYKDIIVHIFDRDSRAFYDLERIWRDGIEVELPL